MVPMAHIEEDSPIKHDIVQNNEYNVNNNFSKIYPFHAEFILSKCYPSIGIWKSSLETISGS